MQGNPSQETSSAQVLAEGELGETGQDDVDLRTHPIAQAKGVWSMRVGASQPRCALRSSVLAGKQLALCSCYKAGGVQQPTDQRGISSDSAGS